MTSYAGVLGVVQEGRFRLDADDGRSFNFTLDHRASIEPQDLARLIGERVTVESAGGVGLGWRLARRVGRGPAR